MRSFWAVLIYLCAVIFGGALIAPWLYQIAHAFPGLAKDEFHFYVQNSFLLIALVGVWPLARFQGMTHLRDVGLVSPVRERKSLFEGALFGFISLALLCGIAFASGSRQFRGHFNLLHLLEKLAMITLTAVGVAVLEETLFRGGIFGSLRKLCHWILALVLSSALYAIVHFFSSVHWTDPVTWHSGLEILPAMFAGFFNADDLIPGFFNLLLAGLLLGLAYQRTGNLWFSIGLHASWIFWIKFNMTFTDSVPNHNHSFFGSNRLINGWLATIILSLTLLTFLLTRRTPKTPPA